MCGSPRFVRTVDVRTVVRDRVQRTPANPHLVRRRTHNILLVDLKQFSLERFGQVIGCHGLRDER